MTMRTMLVPLALVVLSGCGTSETDPKLPGYELSIPDDVPEQITLTDKDGKTIEASGRDRYARAHRQGWAECWHRHRRGELDPRDSCAEPSEAGEIALDQRGRRDGFEACRQMLLRAQR
jgi:hypothetical protein